MRSRWLMGNWKMHGSIQSISQLLEDLTARCVQSSVSCEAVVYPPAPYLQMVRQKLERTTIHWGGQNVYPANEGAFTGEASGAMLKDMGCRFVLVGHSERRRLFGESNVFVAQKYVHVKQHAMIPVLCVGETLQEREDGRTQSVIFEQLEAIQNAGTDGFSDAIIAYEPVWAIGTGKAATCTQVQAVHAFIRGYLREKKESFAMNTPILYGGSVTPENAAELFALEDVDGGLVGGASLEASRFMGIMQCIK